jgi:type IV fimbrial biogenesis protein FimT
MSQPAHQQVRHHGDGFSLIELMVVLAIAAIILVIAVPNFTTLLDRQRLTTVANDLYGSVSYTRAEAIRRGSQVDLVPQDPTDWAKGWSVSIPAAAGASGGGAPEIVYSRVAAPKGLTISWNSTLVPGTSLSYDGTGRIRQAAGSGLAWQGSWLLSLNGQQRKLSINTLGRPRICDPGQTGC